MGSALPHINVPSSAAAYDAALEGLARLDEVILRQKRLPPLYGAGVHYEARPHEVWRHADDVAREHWGDCEDLSGYRVGELRVSGEDPAASIVTYKTGPHRYHAVVRRGSGVIEDPSRILGMPIPNAANYQGKLAAAFGAENVIGGGGRRRGPDCVIGEDPMPDIRTATFDVYPHAGGWAGLIRIPLNMVPGSAENPAAPGTPGGRPVALNVQTSPSSSAPEMINKLGNAAKLVDALPPELKNVIPPQAQEALKTITDPKVLSALKSGDMGKIYNAIPSSVRDKIPPQVQSAAKLLQNPQLVAFLKSDNPAVRTANLLNIMTMARPDIYAQNVKKEAQAIGNTLKKLKFW